MLEKGSGGIKSTGGSQRVRATRRDDSQSVPSPKELNKTRNMELPFLEGSLPSCSPHSATYTRTTPHPNFRVAKTEARAANGARRRKPRKTLAVHFWRGFCLDRGLISPKMSIRMCHLSSPAPLSIIDP